MKLALFLTCGICISFLSGISQISPANLQQLIASPPNAGKPGLREFYEKLNFETAWIRPRDKNNLAALFEDLERCADNGLQKTDYGWHKAAALRNGRLQLRETADSLDADVSITLAALQLYHDLSYGNLKPELSYSGLNYTPACRDIPGLIADGINKKSLGTLHQKLALGLPVIIALEKNIRWLNKISADSAFREHVVNSNKVNSGNRDLVAKLYHLGIVENENETIPDSILKLKVKEVQHQFNLRADGILGSRTIKEMNVPLQERLQALQLSLNYYKWLFCLMETQPVIVVNIPSAYLKVYEQGKVMLGMRVIVGKPTSPTSTLISKVDEVVLYPYWHVPYSIATRELLPAIKRNRGYLAAGNYQVLNKAGHIVDPNSVNWHTLSTSWFPYLIRQSTGCDNALGLLKLNFINPFGIYLHDTPGKSLFNQPRRFFSHGCMRMEKPMEIGHLVLKNNPIAIDTLEQAGCLRNQAPVKVHADVHMPVIVWYNPVDIDSTGQVIFYEDVYKKFVWRKKNESFRSY